MSTLFLDRDGVLNVRTPEDYIKTPEAWVPTERVGEALQTLSKHFNYLFVVTNQAGVDKGLMTAADLEAVHQKMLDYFKTYQVHIHGIYYCPHLREADCPCRKPKTGLAWQALADFPEINLENAWMVGDSASDIQFGQALGLKTVWIEGKTEEAEQITALKPDFKFADMYTFSQLF
jgi:histidinol-phosphate phosphatase family protein